VNRPVRRVRRSWSDTEKQRIVAEAFCAGASVADVARRHGVNANLIFNWRKTVPAACTTSGSNITVAARREPTANPATENTSFVPIGVFARGDDGGPALRVETAPSVMARASPTGRSAGGLPDMRPGLIEIDLVDGTRLRVDAFVNERALQRVLSALKATA
jgi:transposase